CNHHHGIMKGALAGNNLPRRLRPIEYRISQLSDKFDGDCGKYCGFLNQHQLLFPLCSQSFLANQITVGLVISLFTGEALTWDSPLLEKSSPLLHQFKEFVQWGDEEEKDAGQLFLGLPHEYRP
uniref:DUF4939 domain-containing protein n=1 Tax=Chelonoidis abingdonii TaxID=106734 RepID=A0A8C0GA86_CHEAB